MVRRFASMHQMCAQLRRNPNHHFGEAVLAKSRSAQVMSGKDQTSTFYLGVRSHLKENKIALAWINGQLIDEFGLEKNPTYSLSRLVAGGRIFVPCIPNGRVIQGFDYLSFAVRFFEYSQATPTLMKQWSRVMPVSSGKGYVQPVKLYEVLERLD